MTRTHWLIVAVNILAVGVIFVLAHVLGGGFTSGHFPPNTPVRIMRLVPDPEPVATRTANAVSVAHATGVEAASAIEPMAERWSVDSRGTVRMHDH
jgi:hypothetical protein